MTDAQVVGGEALSSRPASPPPRVTEDGEARILIVRLGGTAGVVHALPVLHALRTACPDSEIGWLAGEAASALLEGHPELTRLHVVPARQPLKLGWWRRGREEHRFGEALRSHGYTAAIDLEGSSRSGRLTAATGARIRIGCAVAAGRELSSRYHTHRIAPGPKAGHVVERNLSLIVPLGVRRSEPSFVYPDLAAERARLAEFIDSLGGRPVVLHPGAGWPSSRWPVEHFGRLARRIVAELDVPVVVTSLGAEERPRAEAVARAAEHSAEETSRRGTHVAPAMSPREFVAFVREATLFVGGDTAAMHMAWTAGAPTVVVFGPTSAAEFGPLGARGRSIDAGLGCTGCGSAHCPDGPRWQEGACMRGVKPDAVLETVREMIE